MLGYVLKRLLLIVPTLLVGIFLDAGQKIGSPLLNDQSGLRVEFASPPQPRI